MPPVKRTSKHGRSKARTASRHRFGSHLSIAGGMHHAIEEALRLGFDTVQVFVKNQRQWRASPFKSDDLERWFELLATPNFGPPVAHATYLINLASADAGLFKKSTAAFAEELSRCTALRIPYLVVHPGAAGDQSPDAALARVAEALNRIFNDDPKQTTMPLLETTAGQGSSLGRTFEQLGAIIDLLEEPARVGVCLDTCHVFAAGYDIRDPASYSDAMDSADRAFGLSRIKCWHLNDSKRELGSRVDRHEHIGRGCIGSAGFRNILGDRRHDGTPMVLETPKGENEAGREWDLINKARLRSIASRARRGGE